MLQTISVRQVPLLSPSCSEDAHKVIASQRDWQSQYLNPDQLSSLRGYALKQGTSHPPRVGGGGQKYSKPGYSDLE